MEPSRYPLPIYLVDTSVLARRDLPPVWEELDRLQREAELGTCPLITAEVCYSARNLSQYKQLRRLMGAMIQLPGGEEVEERALLAQEKLAAQGKHRTSIVDLFAASTAAVHGAIMLHYDSDFDRIGPEVGAKTQWVVPRGTTHW